MYEHTATGQLLPILVGTTLEDSSGMTVPILGAARYGGQLRPLGGTMEDPEGQGLVPISLGRKAVDPVTGELSPVSPGSVFFSVSI